MSIKGSSISCPLSLCSGPMNSTPSTGMSFSWMAFCKRARAHQLTPSITLICAREYYKTITCTHVWYFRNNSLHGSALRSPFRNFSANQRLKHGHTRAWAPCSPRRRCSSSAPRPAASVSCSVRGERSVWSVISLGATRLCWYHVVPRGAWWARHAKRV